MYSFGSNRSGGTPPVVKNIIYLNVIMFVATWVFLAKFNIDLNDKLGLHYFKSQGFMPVQIITHMFLHGGIPHIFFNMFGLWMFGRILEKVWGSRRFFIYYMITGIGAALVQSLVNYIEYTHIHSVIMAFKNSPSPEMFNSILERYFGGMANSDFLQSWSQNRGNLSYAGAAFHELSSLYEKLINVPTIGASGAVFGVLLAFGMLFPNTQLMLIFPPIPIKAKWVVIGYGAIELYSGFAQANSNIAHFAHLGGMIFGFILIKYWNHKRTNFY